MVETYWQVEAQGLALTKAERLDKESQRLLDPFGLVLWPGAVVAAQELLANRSHVRDKRVTILGAGVGIEAQMVARLGASSVVATDIHPTTIKLLEYGAMEAGYGDIISTEILDIFTDKPLPPCDLLVVADVLYNDKLARQVARRCAEARKLNPPAKVLISDSQRFVTDFESHLNKLLNYTGKDRLRWESRWLPTFTGSGVLIDTDQTYDVKARVLWIRNETVTLG